MAISPFVKAGVALTSAAMIAAIPAIAPPLTPKDERVVAGAEAKLSASFEELVNTFFGVVPGNDDPDFGIIGVQGVIYQLLLDAADGSEPATTILDTFFPDGFTGLSQLALLTLITNPEAQALISEFYDGGATAVTATVLKELFPGQADTIDTYFSDGVDGLAYEFLNQVGPAETDVLVNIFFDMNNPYDPEGDDPAPAGQQGAFGVLNYLITNSGVLPDEVDPLVDTYFAEGVDGVARDLLVAAAPTPETAFLINSYFAGGVDGVTQDVLNEELPDGPAKDLVNEFFDNGASGVVRYILAGPVPEPEEEDSEDARIGTLSVVEDTDTDTGADVEAPTTPKFEPKLPGIDALSAPIDALPKLPKKFSINKDKALGTEALADTTVEGSEDEILLEGTGAPKPLNFENWKKVGKIADSVGSFLNPKKTEAEPAADKTETKDKGDE